MPFSLVERQGGSATGSTPVTVRLPPGPVFAPKGGFALTRSPSPSAAGAGLRSAGDEGEEGAELRLGADGDDDLTGVHRRVRRRVGPEGAVGLPEGEDQGAGLVSDVGVSERAAFRAYVTSCLPPDCTATFGPHGNSPASVMEISDPAFEAARAALSEEWGLPAAYVGSGGSIPIAGYFKTYLGMDAMLIGFAKDDDQIHSPNEKYDVESFHKGIRSWARILARLS